MSQGLWVQTELLCPWSVTEKQWASCGPAHFIPSQVAAFPISCRASLCDSHSLFWWGDFNPSVFVVALGMRSLN